MTRRSGLGKGLSSLIPADLESEGAVYREIDVDAVVPNRHQPREHFDEEMLNALADSVAEVGVIQPIIVRQSDDGGYELIAGERRWRAAKKVGLSAIPALVRPADDVGSLETAVIENLHREDLNALEEAAAYQQLIDDFGLTQAEVASRVGRSRSAIANTVRLLQLPLSVQRLVVDGLLSAGHARALLAVPEAKELEELAKLVVSDGLTVRQLEDLLREDQADPPPSPSPRPAPTPQPVPEPGVLELEELLASRLETRVSVQLGKGIGKLVIDFADINDLERIYLIITPPGTSIS